MATSPSNTKTLECLCVKSVVPKVCLDPVPFSLYTDPNGDSTQNTSETYAITLESGAYSVDLQDVAIHDTATITYDGNTYNYSVVKIEGSVVTIYYTSSTNNTDTPVDQLCSGDDCKPFITFCNSKVRSSGGIVRAKLTCNPATLRATISGVGVVRSPSIVTCTSFDISSVSVQTDPSRYTVTIDYDQFLTFHGGGRYGKDIFVDDTAIITYDGHTYNYIVTETATNTSVFNLKYVSSTSGIDTPIGELCSIGEGCLPSIKICHVWDGVDWDKQLSITEDALPRYIRVVTFPSVPVITCEASSLQTFVTTSSHCDPFSEEAEEGVYNGILTSNPGNIRVGDTAKITVAEFTTEPETPTIPEAPTPGESFPDSRSGSIYRDDSDYFYWSAEDFADDFPDLVDAGPQYVSLEQQLYIESEVLGQPPGPFSMSSVPGTEESVLTYDVPAETLSDITPSDIYGDSPADIPPIYYIPGSLSDTLPDLDATTTVFNYVVIKVDGDQVSIKYTSSTNGIDVPLQEMCSTFDDLEGWIQGGTCTPEIEFCKTIYPPNPKIEAVGSISSILSVRNVFFNQEIIISAVGEILDGMTVDYSVKQSITSNGKLDPTYIDKFYGDFFPSAKKTDYYNAIKTLSEDPVTSETSATSETLDLISSTASSDCEEQPCDEVRTPGDPLPQGASMSIYRDDCGYFYWESSSRTEPKPKQYVTSEQQAHLAEVVDFALTVPDAEWGSIDLPSLTYYVRDQSIEIEIPTGNGCSKIISSSRHMWTGEIGYDWDGSVLAYDYPDAVITIITPEDSTPSETTIPSKAFEKLYPFGDLIIDAGMDQFVGPYNQSGNLYSFIDEGVFTGDYDLPFGQSTLISDDQVSFIHPDTIHTEGLAQYKCGLTNFRVRPEETRFRIRLSAPIQNYESRIPPKYTINEIKFQDPSGNLIVQYDDIEVKGDAIYKDVTYVNYSTYSSNAKINKTTELYDWQHSLYMHQVSGYTLSFNVKSEALDDAFDEGYNRGFEENYVIPHETYASGNDYLALDGSPLSTQDQSFINPTRGLRISAIEICNSGGYGPRPENYINLHAESETHGRRLERKILPSFMPLYDFDTGIYPSVSSIWYGNNNAEVSNLDSCGSEKIIAGLREDTANRYAVLNSVGPHLDSGKLTLKFSHHPTQMNEITKGAFYCGFDQSACTFWGDPSGAFDTQRRNPLDYDDGFFVVESITLKVKAKKAADSRDYVLDVVGFSDDKLLNVTSAVGGFLQNPSGVGVYPSGSGFTTVDDLGISSESISDKDNFFMSPANNAGGDHYSLVQGGHSYFPVVTGTDFKDYEIPLKIYDDRVTLGKSRDYTMSSMFEHLYLDIYPLPSGASIASAYLLVRYAPQNALMLSVDGGEKIRKIQDGRGEGKIFPISRQSNDNILNAGSGYNPLSTIENLPHAYTTPSSIKSNYSRRWRGMEGTVQGPFDVDMYGFGFENPPVDFPFLSGYYDFDYVDGRYIKSRNLDYAGYTDDSVYDNFGQVSGLCSYEPEIFKNIGWRLNSGTLFENELPGWSGAYKTSDWTSLSSGVENLEQHELYGQISDAFNNVVRISGIDKSINFGPIETTSGFSIFTRFTPDANVSGTSYNLFDSGVLFSKWDSPSDLDFALGYDDGYLCGYSKDNAGNLVTVKDTIKYSGYQFPLSVILTYNDHDNSGLKLYTDNELHDGIFTTLRASSLPFYKNETSADLVLGHCAGSGVGMNMLVSEFGISTYQSGVKGSGTNIVESNPDPTHKQVTAQKFLENHRVKFWEPEQDSSLDSYKLWDYVNEDTYTDWTIGDFKYCQFSIAFNQLTQRTGRDLISFNIKNDGSTYISKNDLVFPSSVSSGVAYHTQIENDFLRFHLSDTADNFYSANRRITKSLPRGYNFAERALVVETVIEHKTDHDILWSGCQGDIGPKLIVSLYTTKQDPYWNPEQPNWGLINRDIHYLEPSSCLMRLDSKFTYGSLIDESESWAIFPGEPRLRDFEERYFSQDVDDMFLQYDLVYPSGPPFESRINIHTAHVRMDDAYVTATADSGVMNLMSSGGNVVDESLNLNVLGPWQSSGWLNLNVFGPSGLSSSGFLLNISGQCRAYEQVNLNLLSYLETSSGINLNISGALGINLGRIFNFNVKGVGTSSASVPLVLTNLDTSNVPDSKYLPLFTWQTTDSGIRDFLPTYLENIHVNIDPSNASGQMGLVGRGSNALISRYPFVDMPLFIAVDHPLILKENVNLTLYHDETFGGVGNSGEMKLFTANYGGVGADYFRWFSNNFGVDIDLQDNAHASLTADNEIRGVDLIGYGTCDGNSTKKAVDAALVTDETVWRPETCNDGGAFRAIKTYTNSTAAGFGDSVGYSGNYYGIRKYSNLIPNNPYLSTLRIITGSTKAIKVPRTFEDWEYGICGPSFGVDACCTADCDQDLVYSGVKLIGDYPYLSGDATITPPSGRNAGDNYGKSVAVNEDLMAVGTPLINIPDGSGYELSNAGTVYLYRRQEDVAGQKAVWQMQDKLMLPSGYRRDYVTPTNNVAVEYDDFSITASKWNIGQEGREFGSSVDIGISGDRETVVVGGPKAAFTRQFTDIETSGIPICLIAFVDNLLQSVEVGEGVTQSSVGRRGVSSSVLDSSQHSIAGAISKYDILYKYFSAPWYANTPSEFQPRIDIKVLVFNMVDPSDDKRSFNNTDYTLYRNLDRIDKSDDKPLAYVDMLSAISGSFFEMFPSGTETIYSGIPPIVGVFQDNSPSLKKAFKFDGKDVVDEFLDFYKTYSYRSGVLNPEIPTAKTGEVVKIENESQQWNQSAIDLLNTTLDTGRLSTAEMPGGIAEHKVLSFITSGIGQEWAQEGAFEFQIPPSSGGRAYVFEKESGVFNCVQEIKSYDDRLSAFESNIDGLPHLSYGVQYHDRYGHAVSISANSEVISIGSPYTTTPCEIYERKDSENQRMYSKIRDWLVFAGLTDEVTRYDELLVALGATVAQTVTYDELSSTNKFRLRIDETFWGSNNAIQLYQPVYHYSYSDIQTTGTWQFILDEYLGTSRLGYSTSVNDDGNTAVFGAPTDSMNLFEDSNIWYKGYKTWGSYTNAGAVRVFESKKYYPHSGVVEFTKFGNLDRSFHQTERDAGFYDQMDLYFGPDQRPFRRTEFSEIEIPRDAGLAFVITPELDAASDEIIDNIKQWLALGDRTLVLVGNDPVYEENGLYGYSNQIVNKILKKLGSRMRIHEADSKEASLPDCVSAENVAGNRYNITKAFVPAAAYTNTKPSNITRSENLFAKGVGKILIDLSDLEMKDFLSWTPCTTNDEDNLINPVCSHPLRHNGDLRAEWLQECAAGDDRVLQFPVNWPFHFDNATSAAKGCLFYPSDPHSKIDKPEQDIVPILTTAEFLPEYTTLVDAYTSTSTETISITEPTVIIGESTNFVLDQEDEIKFSVSGDITSKIVGTNLLSFIPTPPSSHRDGMLTFFDPAKVNDREGILQARGEAYKTDVRWNQVRLSDDSILALQEKYFYEDGDDLVESNSNVVIMASLLGENERSLGNDLDNFDPKNSDQNIYFYINMIKSSCNDDSKLVQLGGWTGRTSFRDAYSESYLTQEIATEGALVSYTTELVSNSDSEADCTANNEKWSDVTGKCYEERSHIDISENVIYSAGSIIDIDVDTIWIASPLGIPSDSEVSILKDWLKRRDAKDSDGNYKYPQTQVVITYSATGDDAQEIAENVAQICEKIGLKSRPFPASMNPHDTEKISEEPRENYGKYFVQTLRNKNHAFFEQQVNSDTEPIRGCSNGYKFNNEEDDTKVEKLALSADSTRVYPYPLSYIPISGGKNADGSDAFKRIIYYQDPIRESVPYTNDRFQIDAQTNIKFTVQPGSGYRMFVNWVSEGPDEEFAIGAEVSEVNRNPIPMIEVDGVVKPKNDNDYDENGRAIFGNTYALVETTTNKTKRVSLDFQAPSNVTEVAIKLHTDKWSKERGEGIPNQSVLPYTPRVLSVSGCLLPVETKETNTPSERWVRDEIITTTTDHPAYEIIHPEEFRPVKHVHRKYCNPDDDCSADSKCYPRCLDNVTEIEDGPVVAAEEFEHFSSAVYGYQRSKIVVLTDSTMIQGQCPQYRGSALHENQAFIRSLYPTSPHNRTEGELGFRFSSENLDGRQFKFVQKLRSPERGSPAKYFAASGLTGTNKMFGDPPSYEGVYGSLQNYTDNEDSYDPANVTRAKEPYPFTEKVRKAKIKEFMTSSPYGIYPRFSGDFLELGSYTVDGSVKNFIVDAGRGGGIPDLMKLTGKDYLDFELAISGCPGDLFGFSVDLTQDKLIVGTPFNAFHFEESISGVSGLVPWASISGDNNPDRSGLRVSANGGAGAAFYFERTGRGANVVSELLPWDFKQKIKPSSVNVGFDCTSSCVTALQVERGDHNLDGNFILENAQRTDQFGHSVAIDADMMVIGAPNHDFETIHHHIYSGTSAFQRKSFDAEFTIPGHSYYDLGSSGVRIDKFGSNSGSMVLNNGAVFNYRHEMVDWPTRTQEWQYAEKLCAHGYNDRIQGNDDSIPIVSGCENDLFGTSVSINRAKRGDSDYTLVVGSPQHDFMTSGNHISSGLLSAGAAYTYDAMLREQIPSIPRMESFIDVKLFGEKINIGDTLHSRVYQNITGDPIAYTTTGIVFSNSDGNIFIEASGYDPSTHGFIAHRPYVESVIGGVAFGTPSSGSMPLTTFGMPVFVDNAWSNLVPLLKDLDRITFDSAYTSDFTRRNYRPSGMSLYMAVPASAIVYNNIGFYTTSNLDSSSGILPINMQVSSGFISSGMNLLISSNTLTNNLNLRVRGV